MDITVEAVRSRIKRGTLAKEKAQDGTVYVVLDSAYQPDQSRPGADQPDAQSTAQDLLIGRLENEVEYLRQEVEDWKEESRQKVEYLRRELEVRNEELRRKDTIIMSLTQRIPELEAAPEPRESTVSDLEDSAKGDVSQDQADGEIKRSWWQRFFGGSASE